MNAANPVETLAIVAAMRDSPWLYTAAATTHIVGFTILVGAVLMFDLRVLGLSRQISVRALARHLLPWSLAALVLIVPTGLAMFSAHADDFLASRPFAVKMGLLLASGLNAAYFHTGPYQTAKSWDTHATAPWAARASAALSIVLWIAVIACGRRLVHV
jgi:hypothetical protein